MEVFSSPKLLELVYQTAWYHDLKFCWQSCWRCKACHMWHSVIGWVSLNVREDRKCIHRHGQVIQEVTVSHIPEESSNLLLLPQKHKKSWELSSSGFLHSEYLAISDRRWNWSSTLTMWTGRIVWIRAGHGNLSFLSWERVDSPLSKGD